MYTLKIILKSIGWFVALVVLFLVAYLVGAATLSKMATTKTNDKQEVTIYIKTNGVHTDIVVPIETEIYNWSEQINYAHTEGNKQDYNYLGMGWGDKGFYLETPTWADLKVSTAFNAAFALGNTAIHATYYRSITQDSSCKAIDISKRQYRLLVNHIKASFKKDKEGNFINIKTNANYGFSDAFYEAIGSYSMFHTCNTWANNSLKKCEQKACYWTPFDKGIFGLY